MIAMMTRIPGNPGKGVERPTPAAPTGELDLRIPERELKVMLMARIPDVSQDRIPERELKVIPLSILSQTVVFESRKGS